MKCRFDSSPTALTNRGSTPGSSRRSTTGGGGHFEEIQHLSDPKPVSLPLDLEHDNGALVGQPPLLLQEQVSVENGQQAASNVDQPLDCVRHTGNAGGR